MKNVLLISILLALCLHVRGQSIVPTVIASSGADYTQVSAQLSFTVGESSIDSYTSGNTSLTLGFHQPKLTLDALDDALEGFSFTVYPNPTMQEIVLDSKIPLTEALTIVLFDAKGSSLITTNWKKSDTQMTLDLQNIAEGTYFLRLSNAQGNATRSFKVQKINQ